MGFKVKDFIKKAVENAAELPKEIWIAALILPGGFVAIGAYTAIKTYIKKEKK